MINIYIILQYLYSLKTTLFVEFGPSEYKIHWDEHQLNEIYEKYSEYTWEEYEINESISNELDVTSLLEKKLKNPQRTGQAYILDITMVTFLRIEF